MFNLSKSPGLAQEKLSLLAPTVMIESHEPPCRGRQLQGKWSTAVMRLTVRARCNRPLQRWMVGRSTSTGKLNMRLAGWLAGIGENNDRVGHQSASVWLAHYLLGLFLNLYHNHILMLRQETEESGSKIRLNGRTRQIFTRKLALVTFEIDLVGLGHQ